MADATAAGGSAWLRRAVDLGLPFVTAIVFWELCVRVFGVSPFYLPPLGTVLDAIHTHFAAFWTATMRTALETVLGFAAGAVIGIGSGIVFRYGRLLRQTVFPIFVVSQTVPVVAFSAIVVLWFGNTIFAKVVISFYLTFFPVAVNTLQGLMGVDPQRIALLRSFGAGTWQILWKLEFPHAVPQIFVALRLGASLSLVGAIVGEWFGDTTGLGVLMLHALFAENIVQLWATILCTAALGIALYGVIAAVERSVVFWRSEL